MYYQYFGLREAPFSIAVNPRYLFMSQRHREALAHLLYGVQSGDGFILLTGEVGTGKTTLNRCLLEQLPDSADVAIVLNPALDATELLATVCDELGIARAGPGTDSLKHLTDALHRFLLDNHARGRRTVLMIDEAQHLSFAVLEQIRLLTNLETHSEKLLHIILIGQPELAQMLQRPELRQLNQRITARFHLQPLTRSETAAYIRHRLQVAGLAPGTELFPPRIVRAIHRHTRGVPRLINLLCDRMLLGAYGRDARRVDGALLRSALRELKGSQPGAGPAPWRRLPQLLPGLAGGALLALGLLWWLRPEAPELPAPVRTTIPARAETAAPSPPGRRLAAEPAAVALAGAGAGAKADAEADAGPTSSPPTRPAWLLAPPMAERALWQLFAEGEPPAGLCAPGDAVGRLRCARERASSWEPLQALGHPSVLALRTPEGFSAAALLLAFEGAAAVLATEEGAVRVPLSSLVSWWSGGYHYLWVAPQGYRGVLAEGQSSPAVAAVASQFARLDGQPEPLSGERFNSALRRRVELFQRAQGLEVDGLIGPQTLQRLNLLLGEVPVAAQPPASAAHWEQQTVARPERVAAGAPE